MIKKSYFMFALIALVILFGMPFAGNCQTALIKVKKDSLCQDSEFEFKNLSSGANSFIWNFPGAKGINSWTGTTPPPIKYSYPSDYLVTLTASDSLSGISDTDSITVNVEGNPYLNTVYPASYPTICGGDSIEFTPSCVGCHSFMAIEWPDTFMFADKYKVKDPGYHTIDFYGVSEHECVSIYQVTKWVNVEEVPKITIRIDWDPQPPGHKWYSYCENNYAPEIRIELLSGSNSYIPTWQDSTSSWYVNAKTQGDYFAILESASGCKYPTDTTSVTVHPSPNPSVVISPVEPLYCENSYITLQADSIYTVTNWFKDGLFFSNSDPATIILDQTSSYTLYVENQYGCGKWAPSVILNVNPSPTKPVLIADTNCNLTTNFGYLGYEYVRDNVIFPWQTSPQFKVDNAGFYSVRVSDQYGCKSPYSDPIYANCLISGILQLGESKVAGVYPNPWSLYLKVRIPDHGQFTAKIYNSFGQEVGKKESIDEVMFERGNNPPGIYFVVVSDEKNTHQEVHKVIAQ